MALPPFQVTSDEQALIDQVLLGQTFVTSPAAPKVIRGEVIGLLLRGSPRLANVTPEGVRTGITAIGIRIDGAISLQKLRLGEIGGLPALRLKACTLEGPLDLDGSTITALELTDCIVEEVRGDGCWVEGTVDISGLTFSGNGPTPIMSFRGARIAGDFKASNVRLIRPASSHPITGRPRYALALSEARIDGRVELLDAVIQGGATLASSEIGSDLLARGLQASAGDDEALNLRASRIRGSLYLEKGSQPSRITGRVYLANADISGAARFSDAELDQSGSRSMLNLRSANIGSDVVLANVALKPGRLDFRGAAINGVLKVDFASAKAVSVDLAEARVGRLSDNGGRGWSSEIGHIELSAADITQIEVAGEERTVSRGLWNDFVSRVRTELVHKPSWSVRQDWFARHVDVAGRYDPHPYETFAAALARSGHNEDSRRLLRRSRWRYLTKAEAWITRPASIAFGVFFGFGYSAKRALLTLALFIIAGALATDYANRTGMLSLDASPVTAFASETGAGPSPMVMVFPGNPAWASQLICGDAIDPGLYAIDVFVPLLDLRQESKCEPATTPIPTRGGPAVNLPLRVGAVTVKIPVGQPAFWRWAKAIYAFTGWILVSLSILTFTGLLQRRGS